MNQLNLLARNANSIDLTVNLEKSNIVGMVVILRDVKKGYYKDSVVKVVNAYKYLGVVLVSRFPIPLKARQQKQKQVLLKY